MTQNFVQGVPAVPNTPMVDKDGTPTLSWYTFFVNLWNRTGGSAASITPLLDLIATTPGTLVYRGAALWSGLTVGASGQVLKVISGLPAWGVLDGSSFGSQARNTFFSAPAGSPGNPGFRTLATTDLTSVAGAIPGVASAALAGAGNVGEVISVSVLAGAAVALTSAAVANVASISLTPGDWDVWATLAVNTTSATVISGWISSTSAVDPGAPNGGAYVLSQPAAAYALPQVFAVGTLIVPVGSTAPVYLSTKATFTGSASAYGALIARRVR